MRRWLCVWAVVGSSVVHASWPTDVQGSCSGTLTETWGDSVTLSCTGDLVLTGVTQRPPTSPRADLQWGELDIQSGAVISVSQPQTADVQRFTGGALTLGSAGIVSLNNTTGFVLAVAPALTVPEPTTWALMLAGALVVVGRRRR